LKEHHQNHYITVIPTELFTLWACIFPLNEVNNMIKIHSKKKTFHPVTSSLLHSARKKNASVTFRNCTFNLTFLHKELTEGKLSLCLEYHAKEMKPVLN